MARSQNPLSLEYILLGFLYQDPIHGYDLYKKINSLESISLVWHIKQNLLYAQLDKLKENGLLTSNIVPGEAYLMRKEYRITSAGRRAFLNWVTTPVSHGRDMRQEFLAKLYFAQSLSTETSRTLIEKQKAECAGWLSSLQAYLSKTEADQTFEKMIFQYRISQTKAMIEWLTYGCANLQFPLAPSLSA